jgi:thiol-disulfide isomerase/thioredoxin
MILIGALLIFVWARSTKGLKLPFLTEGFENNAPDYYLRMYYADWCPHCVAAKPEFAKLDSSKKVFGKQVKYEMIEAEKEPEKVLEKVNGYPTIRLYDGKNTLIDEYGGVRTFDGFMEFVEKYLKNKA